MSVVAPPYPTPITVIDSIMGSYKTQYLHRLMNQQHREAVAKGEEPPRFIYIAVTLDERNRCAAECPDLNFREPVLAAKKKPRKNARMAALKARAEAAKEDQDHERKYASLVQLVKEGANIASTHSLFKLLRRDLTDEFKQHRYRLIIDEALDVVDKYDQVTKEDRQILAQQRIITLDELGRWRWNYAEHPNYKGKFEFLRPLCDNGNLVQARGDVLLWTFPAPFLAKFEEVYIATYLFEGQAMSNYFKANSIPYRLCAMSEDKELEDYKESDNTERKQELADLIKVIVAPRLNAIGVPAHHLENPLSKSWYDNLMRKGNDPQDRIGQARRNLRYFFQFLAHTPAALNMWTCFDGKDGGDCQHESKLRKTLKDDGYARGFVPVNSKATNKYRHKASLAYMCNRFQDPIVAGYFQDHGIEVRSDLFALTELVQWIWRSRIREDRPIHLYLPSERMRQILENWVRYTDAEIVKLGVRLDEHYGPAVRDGDGVQKGEPVDKIVHEKCGKEALTVFENTRNDGFTFYAGYCHYCGESVNDPYRDPYRDRPKRIKLVHKARVVLPPEQVQKQMAEICTYPSRALPARGLTVDSLQHYSIRVAVSEEDGSTPTHSYFPYTAAREVVGYREKELGLGFIRAWGRMGWDEVDMFGWLQALGSPSDILYVTEGEFDAVALWQVLRERGEDPAVVSLNGGVGSAVRNIRRLKEQGDRQFERVVLVFDQDEAGQKAQQEALLVLPAARIVRLSEKDANDCIMKDKAEELYQAAKAAAV